MELKFVGIIGHQNIVNGTSKHTIYILEVHYKGASYCIKHRYHDFKELYEELIQEGYRCPSLPPKKFIGSFNPEFISKRQLELTNWLLQLVAWDPSSSSPDPNHSAALQRFLYENKETVDKNLLASMNGTSASQCNNVVKYPSSQGEEETENNAEEADDPYFEPIGKTCLDDFELLKVIGKGSYGKVTLVKKKDNGRLYAMKSLSKPNVKRRNQVEHTKTERRVLGRTKHPFIVHLHYAFQTKQKLYFVLDYCPGGELFFHLSRMEKFQEHMARFYAAEITLALGHLHDLGVVYRDLKPENILFDAKGNVRLADFGLAKEGITDGKEGTNSMCGTPEYLPPEILDRVGHGTSVDWWALGMVLYEMLTGLPPWYTRNRQKLFERVRNAPLTFPLHVSENAQSLISGLLNRNPAARLGSSSTEQVKSHPFFNDINWDDLYNRKLVPPFNPCQTSSIEETKNFEQEFTKMQINSVGEGSGMGSMRASDARSSMTFQGFTYNTPSDINSLGTSHDNH